MANGKLVTGWKLLYGYKSTQADDTPELPDTDDEGPPQISDRGDQCCSQELYCNGCYVATVDFDKLDQQ